MLIIIEPWFFTHLTLALNFPRDWPWRSISKAFYCRKSANFFWIRHLQLRLKKHDCSNTAPLVKNILLHFFYDVLFYTFDSVKKVTSCHMSTTHCLLKDFIWAFLATMKLLSFCNFLYDLFQIRNHLNVLFFAWSELLKKS